LPDETTTVPSPVQGDSAAPAAALDAVPAPPKPSGPWVWCTGRRKSSVARVRIRAGSGQVMVNGRKLEEFFAMHRMAVRAVAPLKTAEMADKVDIIASCSGGGITGQSDAVMMGVARCLTKMRPELHKLMRDCGFLTRDSRKVERKKYGRPGARKRFQFSKR
jgi:small subunit ribosomal protein S9